jgi:hypothetical protein
MYKVEQGEIKDGKLPAIITMFYVVPEVKMQAAVRYEIWGTRFNESGGDFTQLRLFDEDNNNIHQTECSGY